MSFLLLILGLGVTIFSASVLIDASAKIARRYGVSSFIIGITVVAFGTSAPELAVGIAAGTSGINELSLGNVVGSSMSNIGMIVGIAAVISTLRVRDSVVQRELPILLGIQFVLGLLMLIDGVLSLLDGIILLVLFVLFMVYIVNSARLSRRIRIDAEGDIDTDGDNNGLVIEPVQDDGSSIVKLWIFSILALGGLFLGGRLTVTSSSDIAQSFGLSETLIGLTVVAIATNMPELITSIIAARKKEPEIVLGNCIGSNIINTLLVLGVTASISPIGGARSLRFDMIALEALTLFVFIVALRRREIKRSAGIVLLTAYVAYLAIKIYTSMA